MTYSLESIAQLDHSKEFAALHQKFHQFNPLKVLRVDQFEIRHSNVLAWLLDPNENHKFGSFFIGKLLSRLMTRVENEEKIESSNFPYYLYHNHSFSDLEVYREVKTVTGRYIDLLVVVPSQNLVLVIENKYHTGESIGQLEDYLNYARNTYENYIIVPIFLTLNSDAPSHTDFWVLDYSDILDILSLHLELNHEAIPDSVYEFLMHYTDILREELVTDETTVQLALDVYESNQAAIDLLYLSQHNEFSKLARYEELYQQVDSLTESYRLALTRIYQKQKKTIDYIYKIGSNVLREAFLTFAKVEEFPEDVYSAHIRVPNFILPDWTDFEETIGKPEDGYWLGHGMIIWFERTWNERLKLTIEVGPLQDDNRIALLSALENEGISIRPSSKMEGKKYTRIYNHFTEITDWASKKEIVEGMERMYHDPATKSIFKKIASAVEKMKTGVGSFKNHQEEIETEIIRSSIRREEIPRNAFVKFTESLGLKENEHNVKPRHPSFILPLFRELESRFGQTKERWWAYNSIFVFWFQRLSDDRLKLNLELGPLFPEKRIEIIEALEKMGLLFKPKSKIPSAKFTILVSQSKVINWDDEAEVHLSMVQLYNDQSFQEIIKMIEVIKNETIGLKAQT